MRRPGFVDFIPRNRREVQGLWCLVTHCSPSLGRITGAGWRTRYAEHVGRRGANLAIMGTLFTLLGVAYLPRLAMATQISQQLHWATRYIPLGFYSAGWMILGLYLLGTGLILGERSGRDGKAFIAGQVMPTIWAIVWGVAFFEKHYDRHRIVAGHLDPGFSRDAPRGLVNFFIFLAFSFLFWNISGMMGARQVLRLLPPKREDDA